MRRFEIHNATHTWRQCADLRPWLVVDVLTSGAALCFPISGQKFGSQNFELNVAHPDFPRTGLTKSCFVAYGALFEIRAATFARRRGELAGSLLDEFRFWSNVR